MPNFWDGVFIQMGAVVGWALLAAIAYQFGEKATAQGANTVRKWAGALAFSGVLNAVLVFAVAVISSDHPEHGPRREWLLGTWLACSVVSWLAIYNQRKTYRGGQGPGMIARGALCVWRAGI